FVSVFFYFFFSSRRRHTRSKRDWSSDVCSSDLLQQAIQRRKRIPLDEVRLIVAPLAQGLDFAHSRQIVHRDLKPANLRATPQGRSEERRVGKECRARWRPQE